MRILTTHSAHEAAGALGTRHSPRPLWAEVLAKPGRQPRRGAAFVYQLQTADMHLPNPCIAPMFRNQHDPSRISLACPSAAGLSRCGPVPDGEAVARSARRARCRTGARDGAAL